MHLKKLSKQTFLPLEVHRLAGFLTNTGHPLLAD
jgi:hypothetical protein